MDTIKDERDIAESGNDEQDNLLGKEESSSAPKIATNLQEALELTGTFGNYQKAVFLLLVLDGCRFASILLVLPILELEPIYECRDSESSAWYECKPLDTFCNDASIEHRID